MSSFKRKVTSKTLAASKPSVGTRTLGSSTLVSTGIPSLDDLLGGGLPLSCLSVTLAPDVHSSYGDLIQKYFIAQGIAVVQNVCVVSQDPRAFVEACLWRPSSSGIRPTKEPEENAEQTEGLKIAWRYEQMKQFQTTSSSMSVQISSLQLLQLNKDHRSSEDEAYCQTFDLASHIPSSIVSQAEGQKKLHLLDMLDPDALFRSITEICKLDTTTPLRISIPSFGSLEWGDLSHEVSVYR